MKYVIVRWIDSLITQDEMSLAFAQKLEPVEGFSIGWLIMSNSEGVTVAQDRFDDKTTLRYRDFITIPKSSIQGCEILSLEGTVFEGME